MERHGTTTKINRTIESEYVSSAKPELVIFNTETNSLVDYVGADETPEQAIIRLAEYGTALTPLPIEEAARRHDDAYRTEPVEITEEAWHYALNVLPPVSWWTTSNGESFKMVERLTGCITAIYVRINERHFTFHDDIRMRHDECCKKVFLSKAFQEKSASPHVTSRPESKGRD